VRAPPVAAKVVALATSAAVNGAGTGGAVNAPRATTTCELLVEPPDDAVRVSVNRFALTAVDGGTRTILYMADEHLTVASKRGIRGEDVHAHFDPLVVLARIVRAPPDAGTPEYRAVTFTVGFTTEAAAAVATSAKATITTSAVVAEAARTHFISSRQYASETRSRREDFMPGSHQPREQLPVIGSPSVGSLSESS